VRAFVLDEMFQRLLDERHRGQAIRAVAADELVVVALAGDEGYGFVVEEFVPTT
jgi:hypothetical protein